MPSACLDERDRCHGVGEHVRDSARRPGVALHVLSTWPPVQRTSPLAERRVVRQDPQSMSTYTTMPSSADCPKPHSTTSSGAWTRYLAILSRNTQSFSRGLLIDLPASIAQNCRSGRSSPTIGPCKQPSMSLGVCWVHLLVVAVLVPHILTQRVESLRPQYPMHVSDLP